MAESLRSVADLLAAGFTPVAVGQTANPSALWPMASIATYAQSAEARRLGTLPQPGVHLSGRSGRREYKVLGWTASLARQSHRHRQGGRPGFLAAVREGDNDFAGVAYDQHGPAAIFQLLTVVNCQPAETPKSLLKQFSGHCGAPVEHAIMDFLIVATLARQYQIVNTILPHRGSSAQASRRMRP